MSDTTSQPRESFGVGSIVGESFSLTFRNFLALLALIILPFVVTFAVGYFAMGSIFIASMTDPFAMENMMINNPVGFWSAYAVVILVSIFAFSFTYAAVIRLYFDSKIGNPASLGAAFKAGLNGMLRVFVMYVIMIIIVMLVFMIAGGVMGGVAGATQSAALGIVGGILVAVLFLWFYAAFGPFLAVVVVENQWFGAFGRTLALTKGYRWPIVGVMVLFFLALLLLGLGVGVVMYVATLAGGAAGAVIGFVVYMLATIVMTGAIFAMISLIYARLREIKEGASIQSLADVFA